MYQIIQPLLACTYSFSVTEGGRGCRVVCTYQSDYSRFSSIVAVDGIVEAVFTVANFYALSAVQCPASHRRGVSWFVDSSSAVCCSSLRRTWRPGRVLIRRMATEVP